jgi:NAD(P)-dependent dehydrogenase (short-subunit alcohol dehydrogenase family)
LNYQLTRLLGSGIGRDVAIAFAIEGARAVVFADLNEEAAYEAALESQELAKHPEYKHLTLKVDVTDEKSVRNMVGLAVAAFGRIDYSVNSAGVCINPDIISRTPLSILQ